MNITILALIQHDFPRCRHNPRSQCPSFSFPCWFPPAPVSGIDLAINNLENDPGLKSLLQSAWEAFKANHPGILFGDNHVSEEEWVDFQRECEDKHDKEGKFRLDKVMNDLWSAVRRQLGSVYLEAATCISP